MCLRNLSFVFRETRACCIVQQRALSVTCPVFNSDDENKSNPPRSNNRSRSVISAAQERLQRIPDRGHGPRSGAAKGKMTAVERMTSPREAYANARRAIAEAHMQKLPWLAKYKDQQASTDSDGYSVLGTVGRIVKNDVPQKSRHGNLQENLKAEFQRIRDTGVSNLVAQKRFTPKDTYSPADLNPYKRSKARVLKRREDIKKLMHKGTLLSEQEPLPYTDAQVRREIDYKQVAMMKLFVGRQGAILGRRRGKIRAVTQRKIARAIKNARQMALMPHVGMHPAFPDPAAQTLQEVFDHLQSKAAGL